MADRTAALVFFLIMMIWATGFGLALKAAIQVSDACGGG